MINTDLGNYTEKATMNLLSRHRQAITNAGAALTSRDLQALLIEQHGPFSLHYAPFEYVNPQAKVVLLGITPGLQQAGLAIRQASLDLRAGAEEIDVLKRAKVQASFGGAMRGFLVRMLDSIGLQQLLGIPSCASLWSECSDLVHFTSCIVHPLLLNGKDYSGNPSLLSTPWLKEKANAYITSEISRLGQHVLWIPLGREPTALLQSLVDQNLLNRERVLLGMPHPSGANAERVAAFLGEKPAAECSIKTDAVDLRARHERLANQVQRLGPDQSQVADTSSAQRQRLPPNEKLTSVKSSPPPVSAALSASARYSVPFAKDGSYFGPHLANRNGTFTIGPRGSERKFASFDQALEALKRMPVAYWRRPSAASGTPGIVAAVRWAPVP